ncbi:MAG: RecX family transcriptional regulator [Polyangiaceae bacterium]|nr:RecX family transcriptional regulator [Polyangiaceae bacterium]
MTLAELEAKALAYLDRFDSTASNLRAVLVRHATRAQSEGKGPPAQVLAQIDALVQRYSSSGLVDDSRYAYSLARGLRERGLSRVSILGRLGARGVASEVAERALEQVDADAGEDPSDNPELDAARALVRRRRLGPLRPPAERAARRERDLAVLARAGFSYSVARAALEAEEREEA